MKIILISLVPLLMIACNSEKGRREPLTNIIKQDTVIKHDTVFVQPEQRDWQEGFGLTHDPDKDSIWHHRVSYYLQDENCSGLASDFYYGFLRPSDNGATDELLKLACTDNELLRPFYRWCLNKTIFIQDGALCEHTGVPARKYAEKFPKEFFQYMDYDTSAGKMRDWVEAINYSGYYDTEDYKHPEKLQQQMAAAMTRNCKGCTGAMIKRIMPFTKQCFY